MHQLVVAENLDQPRFVDQPAHRKLNKHGGVFGHDGVAFHLAAGFGIAGKDSARARGELQPRLDRRPEVFRQLDAFKIHCLDIAGQKSQSIQAMDAGARVKILIVAFVAEKLHLHMQQLFAGDGGFGFAQERCPAAVEGDHGRQFGFFGGGGNGAGFSDRLAGRFFHQHRKTGAQALDRNRFGRRDRHDDFDAVQAAVAQHGSQVVEELPRAEFLGGGFAPFRIHFAQRREFKQIRPAASHGGDGRQMVLAGNPAGADDAQPHGALERRAEFVFERSTQEGGNRRCALGHGSFLWYDGAATGFNFMFKIFYTEAQSAHLTEVVDGVARTAGHPEAPCRPALIRDALVAEFDTTVLTPREFGVHAGEATAAIDAVHSPAYREFLEALCKELTPGEFFIPSGGVRNKLELAKAPVRKQAGYYNFGGDTPVSRQTAAAARLSVEAALGGVKALAAGERLAYALCRPPGHHAEYDRYGGFCFFGNAAIAADRLARLGSKTQPGKNAKVAVIDVDYHHGNGTQNLLYERFDAYFLSLHADPRFAYPHFAGWADEIGRGAGEGYNLNLPLPPDTDKALFLKTLEKGLHEIGRYAPDWVVISLGFDIHRNDPVGGLGLASEDFRDVALALKALDRPTLVIQEGGYSQPDIGPSACAFFSAWAE